MKDCDLLISNTANGYNIKVNGRANFEYAVPVRHLANCLNQSVEKIRINAETCTFMDSTFMGVLAMIGLKCKKLGATVEIYQMAPNVKALLKGLGIDKLFNYCECPMGDDNSWEDAKCNEKSIVTTAETVLEAHQVLVEADDNNAAKFKDVIKYADEDLQKLKSK